MGIVVLGYAYFYVRSMEMAVTISNNEYKELHTLRSYYNREKNLESIQSMKSLENDIDIPIKTIVGMFALLGCQPLFSCCGFDYHGQPVHKTHEYGNAYVNLRGNSNTEQVIDFLIDIGFLADTYKRTSQWRTWKVEKDKVVFVSQSFDWEDRKRGYPWTKYNCVHYAEKGVIGLHELRKKLYYIFKDHFFNAVTLLDTNQNHNKVMAYWQYPSLMPWEINKDDLLLDVEKELNISEKT